MLRLANAQKPLSVVELLALYPHLAARLVADSVLPDPRLGGKLVCVLGLSVANTGKLYAGAVLGRRVDAEGVSMLGCMRLGVVVEGLPRGMD